MSDILNLSASTTRDETILSWQVGNALRDGNGDILTDANGVQLFTPLGYDPPFYRVRRATNESMTENVDVFTSLSPVKQFTDATRLPGVVYIYDVDAALADGTFTGDYSGQTAVPAYDIDRITIAPTAQGWAFGGTATRLRFYAQVGFKVDGKTYRKGGKNNWFKQIVCPIINGEVAIPEVVLPPTTDSDVPEATISACFVDSQGRFLDDFFKDYRIPYQFGDETTWAVIHTFNGADESCGKAPVYVPTLDQVAAMIGDAIAGIKNNVASKIRLGNVYLDTPPLDPLHPEVVGVNSPLLKRTIFFEDYLDATKSSFAPNGSVQTAFDNLLADYPNQIPGLASMATATLVNVLVMRRHTIDFDLTTPFNMELAYTDEGHFDVVNNSAVVWGRQTLTGARRLWTIEAGSSVTFANKAVSNSKFHLEWWTGCADEDANADGADTAVDATDGLQMARQSVKNNYGGTILLGTGNFETTEHFNPSIGMILEGSGANSYGKKNPQNAGVSGAVGGGTNLIYTGTEDEFIYLGDLDGGANNTRTVQIKNLNIDTRGTNASPLVVKGSSQNIYGIRSEEVVFLHDDGFGVDINVENAAQVEEVLFDHCEFITGSGEGNFRCNTNNGTNLFTQCYFAAAPNKVCLWLNKIGTTTLLNCHLVGANTPAVGDMIANPGADKVGISYGGVYYDSFATGQKGRFTTTGSLPGGLAPNTDYYLIRDDGSGYFRVAVSLANARAGIGKDITSAGTGAHKFEPAVVEGLAGIYFGFINGGLPGQQGVDVTNFTMMGCQDEGLNYSLISEAFQLHGNATLIGNLFQGNMLMRGKHTINDIGNSFWSYAWRDSIYSVTSDTDPLYTRHPYVYSDPPTNATHILADSRVFSFGSSYGGNRGVPLELVIDPVTRRSTLVQASQWNLTDKFDGYSEVMTNQDAVNDVYNLRGSVRAWVNKFTKWQPFETFWQNTPIFSLGTNQPGRFVFEIATTTRNVITGFETVIAAYRARRNTKTGFFDWISSQVNPAYIGLYMRNGSALLGEYCEYIAANRTLNRVETEIDDTQYQHDDNSKKFISVGAANIVVTVPLPGDGTNEATPKHFAANDVNPANDTVTFSAAHNIPTGRLVRLANYGGALPGNLLSGTDYYAIAIANPISGQPSVSLKFAATPANAQSGTAVNISDIGTGATTVTPALPVELNSHFTFIQQGTGTLTATLDAVAVAAGWRFVTSAGGSLTSFTTAGVFAKFKVEFFYPGQILVTTHHV